MAKGKQDPAADPGPQEPASGTPAHPVHPDEAQPGDRSELGADLGGPIDVFPGAGRGGLDHSTPGLPTPPDRAGPEKRRG